ncbi:GNAT family N-acetyltransferase [Phenylobacterium sp.]|uniref:GNAT family N-acetyltransferase n=1 Tax=Phenylobacterium sp. TaxID=1871053 RepID=UPI0026002F5C|nr:GNAT family N-acetyltransferase [Phenylobacterium sp.]MCA3720878.1 GNAT family N-acetyltransferase [Phenylobacterium sp.]
MDHLRPATSASVTIRLARASELRAIAAIERESAQRFLETHEAWIAQDPPAPEELLAERLEAGGLWVATLPDDRPVAAIRFRPLEAVLYIEQLDVLPEFSGRRLGAGLLDKAGSLAGAAGLEALVLSTFRDIPWNAPWYSRIGFEVIEVLPAALDDIRRENLARGLDESRRVFMRREVNHPLEGRADRTGQRPPNW